MREYIVTCCLMFSSQILSADFVKYDKYQALSDAKMHTNAAINELYAAEEMCIYIPDLSKREHMHSLIASSCAALAVPDPKAKIISIGLSLIGSLAIDMHENYCKFREHLYKAAYHFEMASFYNILSLRCKNYKDKELLNRDKGSLTFLNAINYLTLCDMLTSCIKDKWIRLSISEQITEQRDRFLEQLMNNSEKPIEKLSPEAWEFYENLDEILSDCDDDYLREEIIIAVYAWAEELEYAEKIWGLK